MALRDVLIAFQISVDQKEIVDAEKSAQKLITTFRKVAEVAAVALGFKAAESIAEQADQYTELANKLRMVTKTSEEFEAAQRGVFKVAREVYEPVGEVADQFKRFSFATADLGLSTDETLDFTKRLTQAIKISGADATETNAAMRELSHGLTTNFEGSSRELRALQKNAPLLAKLVGEALGGSAKDFVEFGKQGKITSKVFVDALRSAGPELDRLFKKRVPLFAELKTNVWNDWLALIKQLNPALDRIKGTLGGVVDWIHKWVEDGSAMNSVIAGLIVGVTALAVAFAPFVAALIATVAPFALLFFLMEEIVGFMNGADSLIGRALGPEKAEAFRKAIEDIWKVVKEFFAFIVDPTSTNWQKFYENAAPWIMKIGELLQTVIQTAVAALSTAVANDSILGPLAKGMQMLVGKPGEDKGMKVHGPEIGGGDRFRQEHPFIAWAGDTMGVSNEMRQKRIDAGINPDTGMPLSVSPTFAQKNGVMNPTPEAVFSEPTLGPMANPVARGMQPPGVAPVINNNITVQGDASPAVARETADRAGKATAASLGRDRSAIGAGVGLAQ